MNTTTFDWTMYRGDTKLVECVLLDLDAIPYNLTGCDIWFTAKRVITESDAAAPVYLSTDTEGVTITGATAGRFTVEIPPAKTYPMTAGAILVCDMQLLDVNGRVFTIARGILTVVEDVTRTYA